MYPFYLGIDLHKKRSYVMLIDREGTVIDQRHLATTDMSKFRRSPEARRSLATETQEAARAKTTPILRL